MPNSTYNCICGRVVYADQHGNIRTAINGSRHSCGPTVQPWPTEARRLLNAQPAAYTAATNIEVDILFEEEGAPELPEVTPGSWWSVPLPEGFAWYWHPEESDASVGTIYTNPHDDVLSFAERIAGLHEWASEHGFYIEIGRQTEVYTGTSYVPWPNRFWVWKEDPGDREDQTYLWAEPFTCPLCEGTHDAYTVRCPSSGLDLVCINCAMGPFMQVTGRSRSYFPNPMQNGLHGLLCSNCGVQCSECENLTTFDRIMCNDHSIAHRCDICERTIEAGLGEDDVPVFSNERYSVVCESCWDSICPACEEYSDSPPTFSGDLNAYVCRRCFRAALAGSGEEEFDNSATMTARTMRIPTMPGRENIRLCGVEIEGGIGTGNGGHLAQALYEAGLSTTDTMQGYHHGNSSSFAHVERDSSVDWELVVGPMNPADRADVVRFDRTVRTLRQMVRDGILKLDLRAGCHVHVGAEGVSLDSAFNLNTIFAYVEDVIFRLGAAKWPIHRAIQGSDYARPVPKETRKLQFARMASESDRARYYALSFNNYFNAMMGNCHCGAVRYDSWQDCTCDLGKCTFEFRVFNTTANPRKLHAYLALSQAMVAKAMSLGTVTDPASTFPALAFEPKRFKDMADAEQIEMVDEWQKRLEWLFTDLPLTDDEKLSLLYCVRNSELVNVGDDFINNLAAAFSEQQVIEEAVA